MLSHKLKTVGNSRIDLTGDLTNNYIFYVYYTVTHRTNSLNHLQIISILKNKNRLMTI